MSEDKPKFGVQTGPFTPNIFVGKLNKAATTFLDKEDATDMVLHAVARYTRDFHDSTLVVEYDDATLSVTVTPKEITHE
jgi:hypothetical protein